MSYACNVLHVIVMRNILVMWDDDAPRMWDALFYVLDKKHPEYKDREVTFDQMPPNTQWRFGEPDEATGSVAQAYDIHTYKSYPQLSFTVQNANIKAENVEGEYDGYLVSLKATKWNDKGKLETILEEQYVVIESDKAFEFQPLSRVTYPKLEVTAK